MKNKGLIFITISSWLLLSCIGNNKSHERNEEGYPNGTYCARVHIYYHYTQTRTSYCMEVEIEENLLTKIHWPSNTWSDNTHFCPPYISKGHASYTSDRGVEYWVKILGKKGSCKPDTSIVNINYIEKQLENETDGYHQVEEEQW